MNWEKSRNGRDLQRCVKFFSIDVILWDQRHKAKPLMCRRLSCILFIVFYLTLIYAQVPGEIIPHSPCAC